MLDTVESFLRRRYLLVRQQYRHAEALIAYLSPRRVPEKRFILFGRGRSGTSALVSMLDALSDVRCEGEVLHDYVPFPRLHVLGRAMRCRERTFGCKVLSYQIRDVQTPRLPREAFIRRLHERDGFHILYLHRTNLLRHALSNIRARLESFHEKKDDPESGRQPFSVDPDHVVEWMQRSESLYEYEQQLLEDVPHLELTYEQHIRSPEDHQSTVDTICTYLDIASAPVESSYRKVAPPTIREQVANYDELAGRLDDLGCAHYLD